MGSALEVRNLSWAPRGRADIIRDISFNVPEGQFLAICGANGAGKSSLLRLIYRFQRPRCGSIRLDGRDIWQMSGAELARNLAVVLQEQPSDMALSVRQVVGLGRLPYRRGLSSGLSAPGAGEKAIIASVLARLGLARFSDRPIGTLSGGERQRVMLARALAQQPKMIVLDEPTNHLDIRHRLELLRLLRGLGLTVIATLHDLALAAEYADRVIVLHQGSVLSDGAPAEALTENHLSTAFNVGARVDHSGPHPRFSFHL